MKNQKYTYIPYLLKLLKTVQRGGGKNKKVKIKK